MRTTAVCLLGALFALGLAGCGDGTSDVPPPPPDVPGGSVASSPTSHVVVIVMENKEYDDVIGSDNAPYMTELANRYAAPRSLYGIRHPSLPNYLALIGGDTFGIDDDCTSCHVDAPSLPDQLERAGRSWRAYMQGAPRPCFKGSRYGRYAKKHNPFMYFDSIRESPRRCAHVVPYEQLGPDLRRGELPDFAFVTPDLCADTHDCPVRTGDRFLAGLVPPLLRAIGPRGMVIVTYDEGTSERGCCGVASGGLIPTIVAGPEVRRGATGEGDYSLYSILRTVEDFFDLPPLRGAVDALPLDALFERPPRAERG
ncbi:MAG TPA: alkaline phosphatase family protein [Thermoleophilaceae bacterium]|nr:alkaline phosphatase family protein [Thermoleophilaceae bacterium]